MTLRLIKVAGESGVTDAHHRASADAVRAAAVQAVDFVRLQFPAHDGGNVLGEIRRTRVHEQARRIDLEILALQTKGPAVVSGTVPCCSATVAAGSIGCPLSVMPMLARLMTTIAQITKMENPIWSVKMENARFVRAIFRPCWDQNSSLSDIAGSPQVRSKGFSGLRHERVG